MSRHPLTAVPATRSSLPLLKIRRRIVVGLLAASVVSGLGAGIGYVFGGPEIPKPVVLPDDASVALAQTAVMDFLSSRTSTVPAVEGVDTDFAPPRTKEVAKLAVQSLAYAGSSPYVLGDGTQEVITTEQHRFIAVVGGARYEVTVPMVKAGDTWLLGASPALTPAPATAPSGVPIDYGRLYEDARGADLPTDYRTQIKTWAETFAAEGPASARLYAMTGDTSDRTYSGLGGWSLVQAPEVKSVVPVTSPHPGYIVRVGLVLAPPAANGPTLRTDYDLYLRSDMSQQQPPVVAWGAAGSYRTLEPFVNADQR